MAIDRKAIIGHLSKLEIKGNDEGLIPAYNVFVNQLPTDFWNNFAEKLTRNVDEDLLEAADILVHERVDIYNVSNGERFSTYAIKGERGSGVICRNGAAAWKASKGDLVIIATYAQVDEQEATAWKTRCFLLDESNRIVRNAQ